MDTHGIIVYQEQLQKLWQMFAGFTAPEAEKARKAVAKKWTDQLKSIEQQWRNGASKTLGEEWADKMWERMIAFGRYAFNKSHSCSYILVVYWCAWLKVHFAPEWWSAVMSACDPDRVPRYMNTARLEGVKFGEIDVLNLTKKFSVASNLEVTPGLTSIRGINKIADKLEGRHQYHSVDDFVTRNGRSKRVLEPLIKLGAFKKIHGNIKATWMWYQYRYCTGKDITKLKAEIRDGLLQAANWNEDTISQERKRQIVAWQATYPNRSKVPPTILNWRPKVDDNMEAVMSLYKDDYILPEILEFEKEYLGYYWHSPLDMYKTTPGRTITDIKNSKLGRGEIEVVVDRLVLAQTKANKPMGRLYVTDGLASCTVILWADQLEAFGEYLKPGFGVRIRVEYDQGRNTFTIKNNSFPLPLEIEEEYRLSYEEPK